MKKQIVKRLYAFHDATNKILSRYLEPILDNFLFLGILVFIVCFILIQIKSVRHLLIQYEHQAHQTFLIFGLIVAMFGLFHNTVAIIRGNKEKECL